MKKYLATCLTLLFCVALQADRSEDTINAIKANNFENVHYYLVLQGNKLTLQDKETMVALSQCLLKKQAKKIYPFHNIKDSITTISGFALLAATYACYRVVSKAYNDFDFGVQNEISVLTNIFWPVIKMGFCGMIGLYTGLKGTINTVQGLRCATARQKLADAQKIDDRLKMVAVIK